MGINELDLNEPNKTDKPVNSYVKVAQEAYQEEQLSAIRRAVTRVKSEAKRQGKTNGDEDFWAARAWDDDSISRTLFIANERTFDPSKAHGRMLTAKQDPIEFDRAVNRISDKDYDFYNKAKEASDLRQQLKSMQRTFTDSGIQQELIGKAATLSPTLGGMFNLENLGDIGKKAQEELYQQASIEARLKDIDTEFSAAKKIGIHPEQINAANLKVAENIVKNKSSVEDFTEIEKKVLEAAESFKSLGEEVGKASEKSKDLANAVKQYKDSSSGGGMGTRPPNANDYINAASSTFGLAGSVIGGVQAQRIMEITQRGARMNIINDQFNDMRGALGGQGQSIAHVLQNRGAIFDDVGEDFKNTSTLGNYASFGANLLGTYAQARAGMKAPTNSKGIITGQAPNNIQKTSIGLNAANSAISDGLSTITGTAQEHSFLAYQQAMKGLMDAEGYIGGERIDVAMRQIEGTRDLMSRVGAPGQFDNIAKTMLNKDTYRKATKAGIDIRKITDAMGSMADASGQDFSTLQKSAFGAQDLYRKGFGTFESNIQGMFNLSLAGAGNPRESLEQIMAAAMERGLDNSKNIKDIATFSAQTAIQSTTARASGLDIASTVANAVSSMIDPNILAKSKNLATSQAISSFKSYEDIANRTDYSAETLMGNELLRNAGTIDGVFPWNEFEQQSIKGLGTGERNTILAQAKEAGNDQQKLKALRASASRAGIGSLVNVSADGMSVNQTKLQSYEQMNKNMSRTVTDATFAAIVAKEGMQEFSSEQIKKGYDDPSDPNYVQIDAYVNKQRAVNKAMYGGQGWDPVDIARADLVGKPANRSLRGGINKTGTGADIDQLMALNAGSENALPLGLPGGDEGISNFVNFLNKGFPTIQKELQKPGSIEDKARNEADKAFSPAAWEKISSEFGGASKSIGVGGEKILEAAKLWTSFFKTWTNDKTATSSRIAQEEYDNRVTKTIFSGENPYTKKK